MTGLFPTAFRLVDAAPDRVLVYRCAAVRRALWAWLDGELAPEAVADLEAHLSVCPTCVLEARARGELHAHLRRHAACVAATLPEAARRRIQARVSAASAGRPLAGRPNAAASDGPAVRPLRG